MENEKVKIAQRLFYFDDVVRFASAMINQFKAGNTNIDDLGLISESLQASDNYVVLRDGESDKVKAPIGLYNDQVKDIMSQHGLEDYRKNALLAAAAMKFELSDHEERLCAIGYIRGICEATAGTKSPNEVIAAAKWVRDNWVNQVTTDKVREAFEALCKALDEFDPPVFSFSDKLEIALGHLIEYCRKLEREKAGLGHYALADINPRTEIFDAVKACLKYPNSKIEFRNIKYCAHPECRELELVNGYCEKHSGIKIG